MGWERKVEEGRVRAGRAVRAVLPEKATEAVWSSERESSRNSSFTEPPNKGLSTLALCI